MSEFQFDLNPNVNPFHPLFFEKATEKVLNTKERDIGNQIQRGN